GIKNANGTFFQPGQPLPPNQLPSADINPPTEVASPTLATPYSDQISLGYSWQVNPWLGLNVDASHIKYRDLPYRFRGNPFDPATGKRRLPAFGNFRIWYGHGFADYNRALLGDAVHRLVGPRLQVRRRRRLHEYDDAVRRLRVRPVAGGEPREHAPRRLVLADGRPHRQGIQVPRQLRPRAHRRSLQPIQFEE